MGEFFKGAEKGLPLGLQMGMQIMQMAMQRKQFEDQLKLQEGKNWQSFLTTIGKFDPEAANRLAAQRGMPPVFTMKPMGEEVGAKQAGVPGVAAPTPKMPADVFWDIYKTQATQQAPEWQAKFDATMQVIQQIPEGSPMRDALLKSLGSLAPAEGLEDLLATAVKEGRMTLKEAYEIRKSPQVSIQIGKAAPTAERQKLTQLASFRDQLGKMVTLFNRSYVGPIESRAGGIRSFTGFLLGKGQKDAEKEVIFRQIVKQLGDDLLRLRSGAQINEQEYQRMKGFLPKLTDPDWVFLSNLESVSDYIENLIEIKEDALERSKFISPLGQRQKIEIDVTGMSDEELFNTLSGE